MTVRFEYRLMSWIVKQSPITHGSKSSCKHTSEIFSFSLVYKVIIIIVNIFPSSRENRGRLKGETFNAVCLCNTCSYVFWKVSSNHYVIHMFNTLISHSMSYRITVTLAAEANREQRMTPLQLGMILLQLSWIHKNKDSQLNNSFGCLSTDCRHNNCFVLSTNMHCLCR